MVETAITFQNRGQRLAGMLHAPAQSGRRPALVMLHGFTGSRMESHFLFVKMARRLAAAGYFAMRFDFRGSGESEGAFQEMTIPAEIDDAQTALAWLRRQPGVDPERVALLGLSLGGAVAASVAGEDRRVAALLLWSAVADLQELFHKSAADLATIPPPLGRQADGTFDVGGLLLGPDFLATLESVQPLASIERYHGPVLILHGTRDGSVPPGHADRYLAAAGPERTARYWIEGADHTYSAHVWEEEAFQLTLHWLQDYLPAGGA